MVPSGYHGRCLWIDATRGAGRSAPLPEPTLRAYLGGSGLGTALLLAAGAAEIDPCNPASSLVFAFSPLVGSPLTTSAKFAVVSRSPLTGRINDALSSSGFALAGKRTGHDAIVISGAAPRPSVLVIDEDRVELLPADDVWGLPTSQAEARLRSRLGPDFALAVIGPAGERQVRFASLSHDGRHAGRGGTGAVLGAKRLKAVAVRGARRTPWADPQGLVECARRLSEASLGPATAKYRELGTVANLLVFNRLGALPTRNFQAGQFDGAERVAPPPRDPAAAAERDSAQEKVRKHCAACTIGCEHLFRPAQPLAGDAAVRLEYENLFALGPLCGIDDLDTVLRASQRCDEWGLDTISAGGTIAFAMECAERGLLDASWLRFGDGAALLRALDEIATRQRPWGDLLAEGSRRVAERLGGTAIEFAPQVKGLELPGYEPRALQTMALGLAVGSRGADHNRSGAYEADFSSDIDRFDPGPAGAVRAVETENRAALIDSLILCKFLRGALPELYASAAEMLGLTTGWDVSPEELRITAGRIVGVRKRFNERAGWTPAEDTLPSRFFDTPLPGQGAALTREKLSALIAVYRAGRGWTADGHLPPAEIAEIESRLPACPSG